MTEQQLHDILKAVWLHDMSADEGLDAVWGEAFDGYTQKIVDNGKSVSEGC